MLLVSGEPHPGERTWRRLLKADPSVDLVHFTILRPPEKDDLTPLNELALIAFPVRELFQVKIDEFDLIILDRFQNRGLLPLPYLPTSPTMCATAARCCCSVGPEFAGTTSLAATPARQPCCRPPPVAAAAVVDGAFRPRGHRARRPPSGDRGAGGLATARHAPAARRAGARGTGASSRPACMARC